jgi:predicted nucleic acid-binding protein
MANLTTRVFLDANVLINDALFRHRQEKRGASSAAAIRYLRSNPTAQLYVASMSVVQVVATLSKRARFTPVEIDAEVKRILAQYRIVDLTEKDLQTAQTVAGGDWEDAVQYALSQKMRCFYIVTENVKDFRSFANVTVVHPNRIRLVLFEN